MKTKRILSFLVAVACMCTLCSMAITAHAESVKDVIRAEEIAAARSTGFGDEWYDGRWLQKYAMSVYPYETSDACTGNIYHKGLTKVYSGRDFAVQVTNTWLTNYQTAFWMNIYATDIGAVSNKAWVKGVGGNNASFYKPVDMSNPYCMSSRADSRATNKAWNVEGIWSPDMYY